MKRSLDVYDIYRFGLLTLRSKCKRVQMFSTINSMCVDRKKGQSRLKMWGALCLLLTSGNGSDSRTDLGMDHLPQVGLHFEVQF